MTVQEWLSGLEYNSDGITIEKTISGSPVVILDIRGWSTLVSNLGNTDKAALFQDSVGQFVLEAINEKLENDKQKKEEWAKIQAVMNTPEYKEEQRLQLISEILFHFEASGKTESSYKFQLDNLDWCTVIKQTDGSIVVENEHGSQFDLNELNIEELKLCSDNI